MRFPSCLGPLFLLTAACFRVPDPAQPPAREEERSATSDSASVAIEKRALVLVERSLEVAPGFVVATRGFGVVLRTEAESAIVAAVTLPPVRWRTLEPRARWTPRELGLLPPATPRGADAGGRALPVLVETAQHPFEPLAIDEETGLSLWRVRAMPREAPVAATLAPMSRSRSAKTEELDAEKRLWRSSSDGATPVFLDPRGLTRLPLGQALAGLPLFDDEGRLAALVDARNARDNAESAARSLRAVLETPSVEALIDAGLVELHFADLILALLCGDAPGLEVALVAGKPFLHAREWLDEEGLLDAPARARISEALFAAHRATDDPARRSNVWSSSAVTVLLAKLRELGIVDDR